VSESEREDKSTFFPSPPSLPLINYRLLYKGERENSFLTFSPTAMEPTLASKYANSGYYKTVEELLEHNTVANLQTPKAAYIARRIAPRQSIEQVGSEEENFLCQAVLRTPPSFCENENREKLEKILATVLGQFWKFVPNAKPIIHVTGNAILAHLNQQTEELTFSFWRGQSFSKHNKDLYTV
jgi:hypothetical protein